MYGEFTALKCLRQWRLWLLGVSLCLLAGCSDVTKVLLTQPTDTPSVTLLGPNGGETWQIGTQQTIAWASSGMVGLLRIELSTDGGTMYSPIAMDVPATGAFQWMVTGPETSQALIRLSEMAGSAVDVSDNPFSVVPPPPPPPAIRFLSATASAAEGDTGVSLGLIIENPGPTFSVPVTITGTSDTSDHGLMDFNLSVDAGASTASITFDVADDSDIEGDETVIVTLGNPSLGTLASPTVATVTLVDNDFPSLSVTSPNGGEMWNAGSMQTVTWMSDGLTTLDIEITTDGGMNYSPLATGVDATLGTLQVSMPDMGSGECAVRLTSTSPAISDESDGFFALLSGGNWFVDVLASGANDGSSWTNAFVDILSAIALAEFGDTIHVAQGTFMPTGAGTSFFELPAGVTILGAYPPGGGSRNSTNHPTIFDGDDLVDHVIIASSGTLDGIQIRDGGGSGVAAGGGLLHMGGSLTVEDSRIATSDAQVGGGIASTGVWSVLTLVDSLLEGNTSTNEGSGLHADAGAQVFVSFTEFRNNSNAAVKVTGGASIQFFEGTINNNNNGGLILDGAVNCEIDDVNFQSNQNGTGGVGGALQVRDSDVFIVRSSFQANIAENGGGAIAISGNSDVTIENCRMTGNTSTSGTGISTMDVSTTGTVVVRNSTFFATQSLPISGSSAGNYTVVNSIIWGTGGASAFGIGGTVVATYSAIVGGHPGTGNIATDPLMVAPTAGNVQLQSGSPCIDAANGDEAPTLDFSDDPRVDLMVADTGVGTPSYVDIGARERQTD